MLLTNISSNAGTSSSTCSVTQIIFVTEIAGLQSQNNRLFLEFQLLWKCLIMGCHGQYG